MRTYGGAVLKHSDQAPPPYATRKNTNVEGKVDQGHDVRLEPAAGGDNVPGVLAAHLLQYVQRVGNEGELRRLWTGCLPPPGWWWGS